MKECLPRIWPLHTHITNTDLKNSSNIHCVESHFPVPLSVYVLGLGEGVFPGKNKKGKGFLVELVRLRQPDVICETLLLQRMTR